jgi:hypothetical protein
MESLPKTERVDPADLEGITYEALMKTAMYGVFCDLWDAADRVLGLAKKVESSRASWISYRASLVSQRVAETELQSVVDRTAALRAIAPVASKMVFQPVPTHAQGDGQ